MGEFRIGRKFARHSYPDNPRAAALSALARNFAIGPTGNVAIATAPGTLIPWTLIEAGPISGTDVQITPRATGRIRISAVFSVLSLDSALTAQARVLIGGVEQLAPFTESTVDALGFETLAVLAEYQVTVGAATTVSIRVIRSTPGAGTGAIVSGSATIDVQEVPIATG